MPTIAVAGYELFERLRWTGVASCPHCGANRVYLLRPRGGTDRRTRTGASTARRVWKCGACRRQFSVLSGTVFEASRVAPSMWVRALDGLVGGDAPDESARARARRLGVDATTARRMDEVLRAALALAHASDAVVRGTIDLPVGLAPATGSALHAILHLERDDVVAVRRRTATRPTAQQGPSADYR